MSHGHCVLNYIATHVRFANGTLPLHATMHPNILLLYLQFLNFAFSLFYFSLFHMNLVFVGMECALLTVLYLRSTLSGLFKHAYTF